MRGGREFIIAATFGVIVAILLVQGLTMAPLIRMLKVPTDRERAEEEALARRHMVTFDLPTASSISI